jgi:hypothetical protein
MKTLSQLRSQLVESIDPSIAKQWEEIDALEEGQSTYEPRYKTGDHVHKTSRYSPKTTHGVVMKHNQSTAHVHFDDGTTAIHSSQTGVQRGTSKNYDPIRIRHNQPGYAGPRLSNDEHKAILAAHDAKKKAERDHEGAHTGAMKALGEIHASHFTPDHITQLHKIAAEAQATREAAYNR